MLSWSPSRIGSAGWKRSAIGARFLQFRWQQVSVAHRADGPTVELVDFDISPAALPHYQLWFPGRLAGALACVNGKSRPGC